MELNIKQVMCVWVKGGTGTQRDKYMDTVCDEKKYLLQSVSQIPCHTLYEL